MPEVKRKRIALETLEIYAPIADRLGMGSIKNELEDLAFVAIDPDAYQHALEVRRLVTKETQAGLTRVQKDLQHALARKNLKDFTTSIRVKGLWSLHQKLKRKNDDITRIHDISAMRVIVPTIDDCYTALGVIHALWKPLPGEFKDYISFPKPNGYQSLHTTVITADAGIVEMQVRTIDMHKRAQFGIASHMSYKTLGKAASSGSFNRLSFPWVRDLIPTLLNFSKKAPAVPGKGATNHADVPRWLTELAEAHAGGTEANEFVEGLQSDFFSHRIFVFTPRGMSSTYPPSRLPSTSRTPYTATWAITCRARK